MSDTAHTCCICGHEWNSPDRSTEKKVRQAAKVNKAGPYCSLCHHLEMADRHARSRGYQFLYDSVLDFLINRARKSDANPAYAADLRLIKSLSSHDQRARLLASQHQQPTSPTSPQ